MRISRIEVYEASIDLQRPFVIATDTITTINSVIIRIVDDRGNIGWGEAAPQPVILGETPGTVISCLDLIARDLIGKDPRRIEEIVEMMDRLICRNTAAKAAIDMAIHDLVGKAWGEPLWRLLGGARERIETDLTIGIRPLDTVLRDVRSLLRKGFKVIKLKVGESPEEDIGKVRAVREAIGDEVRIRIDANQGWTHQQAIQILRRIAEYGVEFVEQPLPAAEISGLASIRQATPIPVMADESVHQPEDVIKVIKEKAVDYINIKLMKSGGFWKARKIAAIAEAAGIGCMVGSMVETNLGITAAAHFAAAVKNIRFGDLDMGFSLEPKDRLIAKGGAEFDEGYVIPPNEPGLGVIELKESLLRGPINIYE
ncbi:MAG: mandelate racemase/muconate lactonizing enzyme family protein [Candidatus Bipolaricaulia bacterium]